MSQHSTFLNLGTSSPTGWNQAKTITWSESGDTSFY